ncbi:hypothetical protein SAMN04488503_2224 [Humidesulfovibrio mexicanus]|uniref:Uncharacterized protein n=1 Tax=Humidesulfovibrio mexicanus TaxID=147047 RepID=A0A239AW28_9BACT|nr:phage regulatory CII family protein [Humidesulfovibrio mexicanus]SNR99153.1 hypothetical protein SAMN04488503_2224 [Humidesulfovibrio mexicanus]
MAQMMKLVALLHESVESAIKDGRTTKEELLVLLDKAPSTLNNELNPFPTPNKLGLEDAWKLIQKISDTSVLAHMATALGFLLRSNDEACPDQPTLPEEMLDDVPALAAYHQAMRDELPTEQVHAKLQAHIRECEQDFVAYRTEHERRTKVKRGRPAA